jgi:hypothetical protein
MNLTQHEIIFLVNLIHEDNNELHIQKSEALPQDKSAFTRLIQGNNKLILKLESLL